jgi:hypothetical protein
MISFYVANTDNDWFDFLSSRENLTEVNFWQPGGKAFHAKKLMVLLHTKRCERLLRNIDLMKASDRQQILAAEFL